MLAKGEGITGGVNIFEDLSRLMMDSSLCGLGQAAPVPIIDTLKYFRNYYENRIKPIVFLEDLEIRRNHESILPLFSLLGPL